MPGEGGHGRPVFLPGGRRFLFSVSSAGGGPQGIFAGSLESVTRTPVLQDASHATYAGGHLFFLRDGAIMAQQFDAEDLELLWDTVRIGEPPGSGTEGTGVAAFSVSESGVLAYQAEAAGDPSGSRLVWFDRAGVEVGRLGEAADYGDLSSSPDGARLAVSVREPGREAGDIWIFDVAKGTRTRLTSGSADDTAPVWSPPRFEPRRLRVRTPGCARRLSEGGRRSR